ncbi:hypothetical protein DFJ77DRAFT_471848 [Powellomyces hirtus]|nr:hypothetical protein DFJ77DRAFT_471848 [Powellomyces hirtus]
MTETTQPPPPALVQKQNPKDSMRSTWRTSDRATWSIWHYFFIMFDVLPTRPDQPIPVHAKTEKVPYLPDWHMHRWVLVRALIPFALQYAYVRYTDQALHPIAAFFFYSWAFKLIGINELHGFRKLGHKYGFFDGDHVRDDVPDTAVGKVVRSLMSTSTFRPMMATILAYSTQESKVPNPHWAWLPLTIGLHGIVLDFWFYWYHRIMHESKTLWKYHRTHHLTKHPNPLLTLYADTEQEIFDIVGIPLMTYLTLRLVGIPFNFYDWWICGQYVVFAELAGHSGLRVHATPPSTATPFLRLFDADLVIEDHDLHHRRGWKISANYGKQTRLWDRVFGTCRDRIESTRDNVDYKNRACFPLF